MNMGESLELWGDSSFALCANGGAIKTGELEQWSFGAGKGKTIAHFGGWGLHSGKSH